MKTVIAAATGVLLLFAAVPALAGCGSDSDCKGDRLCHRGECVEPDEVRGAGNGGIDRRDRELAEEREGDSRRRVVWGFIFGGIGTGVGAGNFGALVRGPNESVAPMVLSTFRLAVTTAGVLSAQAAGPKARQGLSAMGLGGAKYPALRGAGWALYVTSGVLTFANIGSIVAWSALGDTGSFVAVASTMAIGFAAGLTSLILFSVDGIAALRELQDERRRFDRRASFRRPPLQIAVAPWVAPGENTSAGLALTGRW